MVIIRPVRESGAVGAGEPGVAARPGTDLVRELARRGRLADTVARTSVAERRALTAATYTVTWPVVFARLTRPLELRRGHFSCAHSFDRLAPECVDGFHDDVQACVEDVLHHADKPIVNLEAWIASRLTAVTVDAHRRRRGRRGALQRPRVPVWLRRNLRDDPWLVDLAVHILLWVGSTATAGRAVWPVDEWAHRRAAHTHDWASRPADVQQDIEMVLAAMRVRPAWYLSYVEIPLGNKPAPVAPASSSVGRDRPEVPLALTQPYELEDAHLSELAAQAIEVLRSRVRRGGDPGSCVTEVIGEVFSRAPVAREMESIPHLDTGFDSGRVTALLDDPAQVSRIVAAVQAILAQSGPTAELP